MRRSILVLALIVLVAGAWTGLRATHQGRLRRVEAVPSSGVMELFGVKTALQFDVDPDSDERIVLSLREAWTKPLDVPGCRLFSESWEQPAARPGGPPVAGMTAREDSKGVERGEFALDPSMHRGRPVAIDLVLFGRPSDDASTIGPPFRIAAYWHADGGGWSGSRLCNVVLPCDEIAGFAHATGDGWDSGDSMELLTVSGRRAAGDAREAPESVDIRITLRVD